MFCSQDQWDIYKLDPYYDCLVRKSPAITTIRRTTPGVHLPSDEPTPLGKRTFTSREPSMSEPANKRLHLDVTMESIRESLTEDEDGDDEQEDDDEEDEDLVAEMVTDDRPQPRNHRPGPPPTSAPEPSHTPYAPKKHAPLPKRAAPTTPTTPKPQSPKVGAPLRRRQSRSVPPEPQRKRKGAQYSMDTGTATHAISQRPLIMSIWRHRQKRSTVMLPGGKKSTLQRNLTTHRPVLQPLHYEKCAPRNGSEKRRNGSGLKKRNEHEYDNARRSYCVRQWKTCRPTRSLTTRTLVRSLIPQDLTASAVC